MSIYRNAADLQCAMSRQWSCLCTAENLYCSIPHKRDKIHLWLIDRVCDLGGLPRAEETCSNFTPSFVRLLAFVCFLWFSTIRKKMHTKPGQKEPTILVKFVSAGLAASVAEAATIPIDTAKVRLQVREFVTNWWSQPIENKNVCNVFSKLNLLSMEFSSR